MLRTAISTSKIVFSRGNSLSGIIGWRRSSTFYTSCNVQVRNASTQGWVPDDDALLEKVTTQALIHEIALKQVLSNFDQI